MEQGHPQANMMFVGLHMPKCYGTTIIEAIAPLMKGDFLQISNLRMNRIWLNYYLMRGRVNEAQLIFGHLVHEEILGMIDRDFFLFSGLRRPDSRLHSEARYLRRTRGEQFDLQAWLGEQDNPMCSYLLQRFPSQIDPDLSVLENAIGIIDKFNFVYTEQNFLAFSQFLFNQLGYAAGYEDFYARNVTDPAVLKGVALDFGAVRLDDDWGLYQHCVEKFRIEDIPMASARQHFGATNPQGYRDFFYGHQAQELEAFGELGMIIGDLEELLKETIKELAFMRDVELTGLAHKVRGRSKT